MENMIDFFTARAGSYDEHMLKAVEGCKEAYVEMAERVPGNCKTLLDLGCGTGLELDEIYKRLPTLCVTGIDLTQAMLDRLRQKHADKKRLNLICGSYFDVDFGKAAYDCAVSFQTMHHFSHEKKRGLYQRVHAALKENGRYIECDYMVEKQEEEDLYFAENTRLRREMRIPEEAFYHYDTPCTVANQIALFRDAGFAGAEQVFRKGNTTIVIAYK